MKKDVQLPSVYRYNDFRRYLADYQEARQNREPDFTKSEFSRMLQLPNTRSYFTDVLKGKNITATFIERFITVIGFKRNEAQYFRTLVRFNQASNAAERELFFEQLISLNRTPTKMLDKSVIDYYSKWYYSVVRATLETIEFTDDYNALAGCIRPRITPGQAKKAVSLLLKLELAAPDENGFIKPVEKSIQAPGNFSKEILLQYQLQCLDLIQKIMVTEPDHISFSWMNMVTISEKGYKRLELLMEKFQSQVRSLIHKDENNPDRVLQIHLICNKLSK